MKFTTFDLSAITGYSHIVIAQWCRKGLLKAKKKNRKWIIDERDFCEFIRKYKKPLTPEACEFFFGEVIPELIRPRRRSQIYSDTEKHFIASQYPTLPAKELAKKLGRSIQSVYVMAHRLRKQGSVPYKYPKYGKM